MSKLTLEEAISHCLEVAENNEQFASGKWIGSEGEANRQECEQCAADHRQLAEWLTDYKELKNSIGAVKLSNMKEALELIREYKAENTTLREENKVLIQECDRLIKEKGELLSKVSGGDVLRICQLEEQLQVEIDNSHCLEIELAEAKRLLKAAVEDFVRIDEVKLLPENTIRPMLEYTNIIDIIRHKWRYADEAEKLIES